MKKLLAALLFMIIYLTGCAKKESLDFDNVQTYVIKSDKQSNSVIIPKDMVEVPSDIQEIIDAPIFNFEKFMGPHVSGFSGVNDIPADDLVLIAVFSKAGLSQREGSYKLTYEALNGWLVTVFGKGDYLQLRNSSFYKPESGLFEFEQGDFTYIGQEFTFACEGFEKKGDIVKIKLSKYLIRDGWYADGIFLSTRGYELKQVDGTYYIKRVVDYVKVENSYSESSQPLTFDPMLNRHS